MRKDEKFLILPYLLTCIGTAARFFYIMAVSARNEAPPPKCPGSVNGPPGHGTAVIATVSVILHFYTNTFSRSAAKGLGLFQIPRDEKRHIARILTWETLFTR
jgi:putative ABC transport system permease protein